MIRPQAVALPILREALPGVAVVSAVPDVDRRTFPMVVVQRAGGTRNPKMPRLFGLPEVELMAYSPLGPVEAEELYELALDTLYAGARIRETRGAALAPSEYPDTWKVDGQLRVAVRSP